MRETSLLFILIISTVLRRFSKDEDLTARSPCGERDSRATSPAPYRNYIAGLEWKGEERSIDSVLLAQRTNGSGMGMGSVGARGGV